MPELLISFRRPASLAAEDLRSWLANQTRAFALLAGRLAAEPATSDAPGAGPSLLEVSLPPGAGRTADDRITELLTDMRMLGLNPHSLRQSTVRTIQAHHRKAPTVPLRQHERIVLYPDLRRPASTVDDRADGEPESTHSACGY